MAELQIERCCVRQVAGLWPVPVGQISLLQGRDPKIRASELDGLLSAPRVIQTSLQKHVYTRRGISPVASVTWRRVQMEYLAGGFSYHCGIAVYLVDGTGCGHWGKIRAHNGIEPTQKPWELSEKVVGENFEY